MKPKSITGKKPKLVFKIRTRPQEYGDGRTFYEYTILIFSGKRLSGIETEDRRVSPDRTSSLRAARSRVRVLKSHRLIPIRVTGKHISDGESRNCNTCAIAQALWHTQESIGLPKEQFQFDVCPYSAWTEPRGIVLWRKRGEEVSRIPATELPEMVYGIRNKRVMSESMMEFAMGFDEWAESRGMSLKEWREEHGHADDERPYRPSPCSFVLDLDAMQPAAGGAQ